MRQDDGQRDEHHGQPVAQFHGSIFLEVDLLRQQTRQQQVARPAEIFELENEGRWRGDDCRQWIAGPRFAMLNHGLLGGGALIQPISSRNGPACLSEMRKPIELD